MRFKTLAGVLLLTGCVSGSSDSASETAEPYTGPTIPWDLTVENGSGTMADVEVCTLAGCAHSAADGSLHLELPVGESIITAEHPDVVPRIWGLTIDDALPPEDSLFVWPKGVAEAIWQGREPIDWTKAQLLGQVIDGEGTVVSLEPSVGDAPVYASGVAAFDPELTATIDGFAGFAVFNIDHTGPVDVVFEGPASGCASTVWSIQGASSTQTTIDLRPGFMSTTELRCTP